jgi:ubiquinone/menaquinone biosynthesis C-methylase UbiE
MKAIGQHEQDAMQEYYNRRAPEYEEKYYRDEPARQSEQQAITDVIRELFAGRSVLEVACGTGFWTEIVAQVARHVVATDTSVEMLAIAAEKDFPPGRVELTVADAYNLVAVPGEFNAGLANFWFSHVRKADIGRFLGGFQRRLGVGALVFMCDDVNNLGIGGEFVQHEGEEDTYKKRSLRDGSYYVIVKNYYDEEELRSIFEPHAEDLRISVGARYWWVSYRIP